MRAKPLFNDRRSAGQALARRLARLRLEDPVILALPRGGVPVAVEVARALDAAVDLVFVRKIGVPFQPELAAAAVVDGGDAEIVVNEDVRTIAGLTHEKIRAMATTELTEIDRRRRVYLAGRDRISLEGRVVVVVDDGIATGASVRAALTALRRKNPKRLVLAVPVAPSEILDDLLESVDDMVCLATPEPFIAVGEHYRDFHQVPDREVIDLMDEAAAFAHRPSAAVEGPGTRRPQPQAAR